MRQKIQLWLKTSLILSLLDRASAAVYRMLREGMFGRIFTAYSREDAAFAQSAIGNRFRRNAMRRESFFTRAHHAIVRSFEDSTVLRLCGRLSNCLLGCSLRVYGLFFTSFGIYVVLIYLIKRFALALETASLSHLLIGACLLVSVWPLLFSRQPLAEALLESAIFRPLLLHVAGIPREQLENRRIPGGGRNNVAFILGMLVGALTYFVPPDLMLMAFFGIVAVMVVVCFPEVGVLAMIAFLPYLTILPHPSIMLAAMVLMTSFCYLIKLMRGKRVFRLELLDVGVALFMLAFLFGGLISFSGTGSLKTTAIYVCFMLGYFLVVNLMRTRVWLRRCVGTFLVSGLGAALYGIYQNFFGLGETKWLDADMFADIEGRVVSMFENPNMLADYLIMLIPIAFAVCLCTKDRHVRFGALFVTAALGLCLIYTWSRGAWLGVMIGMLIFLLLWSRRTLSALFLGCFALPLLPLVLPDSIMNRLLSIGNLADSSTSYRVSIWKAALGMARDFFTTGIGVGESAFRQVYPLYSLSGIEAAPHSHNLYLQIQIELGIVGLLLFLGVLILFAQCCFDYNATAADRETRIMSIGCFSGLIAALAQGMTDYIWYNYRVFFVFWLVLALASAYVRVGRSEATRDNAGSVAYADATRASIDIPLQRM